MSGKVRELLCYPPGLSPDCAVSHNPGIMYLRYVSSPLLFSTVFIAAAGLYLFFHSNLNLLSSGAVYKLKFMMTAACGLTFIKSVLLLILLVSNTFMDSTERVIVSNTLLMIAVDAAVLLLASKHVVRGSLHDNKEKYFGYAIIISFMTWLAAMLSFTAAGRYVGVLSALSEFLVEIVVWAALGFIGTVLYLTGLKRWKE